MAAPDFVASNIYAETTATLPRESRTVPRALFRHILALAEMSADCFTCSNGFMLAGFLSSYPLMTGTFERQLQQVALVSFAFAVFTVFLQLRDGAYYLDCGLLQIRESERAIRIPVQALAFLWLFSHLLGQGISGLALAYATFIVPTLLILQKQFLFTVVRGFQRKSHGIDRVVIYGEGDEARSAVSTLLHSPRLGFLPVAVITDNGTQAQDRMLAMGYRRRRSVSVYPGPLTSALLKSLQADLLILATHNLTSDLVLSASDTAKEAGVSVAYLSRPVAEQMPSIESIELDGLRFTTSKQNSRLQMYSIAKRITDCVLSSLLLALLAPLFLLIAILIRFDSPGPAFFVQERVGQNGVPFRMFKFRSMHVAAPKYDSSPTTSRDPRITRIGRILRRASLDELPQLINVLKGDMSLVGPRPEMPFIVERYSGEQRQRLQVIPGITGLWQLSADRSFPIHHNIQYDLYYIRNRSFTMDIAILIHTLFLALHGGI